jgi:hypothetical protein
LCRSSQHTRDSASLWSVTWVENKSDCILHRGQSVGGHVNSTIDRSVNSGLQVLDGSDHVNSCKPLNKDDAAYTQTLEFLQEILHSLKENKASR